MVQRIRPATQTKVLVVPRDGELEITLNINVTVDGQVTATATDGVVDIKQGEDEDDKVEPVIPDFSTGLKLDDFGKE